VHQSIVGRSDSLSVILSRALCRSFIPSISHCRSVSQSVSSSAIEWSVGKQESRPSVVERSVGGAGGSVTQAAMGRADTHTQSVNRSSTYSTIKELRQRKRRQHFKYFILPVVPRMYVDSQSSERWIVQYSARCEIGQPRKKIIKQFLLYNTSLNSDNLISACNGTRSIARSAMHFYSIHFVPLHGLVFIKFHPSKP
jgi:hypothetical protein